MRYMMLIYTTEGDRSAMPPEKSSRFARATPRSWTRSKARHAGGRKFARQNQHRNHRPRGKRQDPRHGALSPKPRSSSPDTTCWTAPI